MRNHECNCGCGESASAKYSLGIFAGYWTELCFQTKSGYRKEGPEGFDPGYAGERYDDDY